MVNLICGVRWRKYDSVAATKSHLLGGLPCSTKLLKGKDSGNATCHGANYLVMTAPFYSESQTFLFGDCLKVLCGS